MDVMTENKDVPKMRFSGFDSNWKRTKLSDFTKIERGKFSPRPRNNPIYYGGNIPFVQTGDVVHSKGRISKYSQTLNEKGLSVSKKFEKGTILITIAANIGFSGILETDMACPDSLIGVTCNDYNHNIFLQYLFEIEQPKMDYLAVAAAQKNINLEFLSPYKFTIPSLPEQQKIASFLNAVDEKLQQLKKKKVLLEGYKKGVMQKIFSQELRFKDANGNKYPDWEEKKLGEVDIYISDGNYGELYPKASEMKQSGIPFVRANNIKNLRLVWNDMGYIDAELHSVLTSGHLKTDDILVTTRGDIGMVAIVSEDFNGANINAQICLLRVGQELNAYFLLQFLGSVNGKKQFKQLQTGSALKQLPKGNLRKIKLKKPFIEEQQKIANFLSSLDSKIDSVSIQIKNTKAFKKGLLQQMFV